MDQRALGRGCYSNCLSPIFFHAIHDIQEMEGPGVSASGCDMVSIIALVGMLALACSHGWELRPPTQLAVDGLVNNQAVLCGSALASLHRENSELGVVPPVFPGRDCANLASELLLEGAPGLENFRMCPLPRLSHYTPSILLSKLCPFPKQQHRTQRLSLLVALPSSKIA